MATKVGATSDPVEGAGAVRDVAPAGAPRGRSAPGRKGLSHECRVCSKPGIARECCGDVFCNACYYGAVQQGVSTCPGCSAQVALKGGQVLREPPAQWERIAARTCVGVLLVLPIVGIIAYVAWILPLARTVLGFRCTDHESRELRCVAAEDVFRYETPADQWRICDDAPQDVMGCVCGRACSVSDCLVDASDWDAGWDFLATGPSYAPSLPPPMDEADAVDLTTPLPSNATTEEQEERAELEALAARLPAAERVVPSYGKRNPRRGGALRPLATREEELEWWDGARKYRSRTRGWRGAIEAGQGDDDMLFHPVAYEWQDALADGLRPDKWQSISGWVMSSACGSVSGSHTLRFRGADPRTLRTRPMYVPYGGQWEFWLIYGTGIRPGCTSMEAGEVHLQASVDGGGNWSTISVLPRAVFRRDEFVHATVEIPRWAWSTDSYNTSFRWTQPEYFSDFDVWAIDLVRFAHWAPPSWGTSQSMLPLTTFPSTATSTVSSPSSGNASSPSAPTWDALAADVRSGLAEAMCCASCPECPRPDVVLATAKSVVANSTAVCLARPGSTGDRVRRATLPFGIILVTGGTAGFWLILLAAIALVSLFYRVVIVPVVLRPAWEAERKRRLERRRYDINRRALGNKLEKRSRRRARIEAEMSRRKAIDEGEVDAGGLLLADIRSGFGPVETKPPPAPMSPPTPVTSPVLSPAAAPAPPPPSPDGTKPSPVLAPTADPSAPPSDPASPAPPPEGTGDADWDAAMAEALRISRSEDEASLVFVRVYCQRRLERCRNRISVSCTACCASCTDSCTDALDRISRPQQAQATAAAPGGDLIAQVAARRASLALEGPLVDEDGNPKTRTVRFGSAKSSSPSLSAVDDDADSPTRPAHHPTGTSAAPKPSTPSSPSAPAPPPVSPPVSGGAVGSPGSGRAAAPLALSPSAGLALPPPAAAGSARAWGAADGGAGWGGGSDAARKGEETEATDEDTDEEAGGKRDDGAGVGWDGGGEEVKDGEEGYDGGEDGEGRGEMEGKRMRRQGSGWVHGGVTITRTEDLRAEETYRNKYELAQGWRDEAPELDVTDERGEIKHELRVALRKGAHAPKMVGDLSKAMETAKRVGRLRKALRGMRPSGNRVRARRASLESELSVTSDSSAEKVEVSDDGGAGVGEGGGKVSAFAKDGEAQDEEEQAQLEAEVRSLGSLHTSDLTLEDLSTTDFEDLNEERTQREKQAEKEKERLRLGLHSARLERPEGIGMKLTREERRLARSRRRRRLKAGRRVRAERTLVHAIEGGLDGDGIEDDDGLDASQVAEAQLANAMGKSSGQLQVEIMQRAAGTSKRRLKRGRMRNEWVDRFPDGSTSITFRGDSNPLVVYGLALAATAMVAAGLLGLLLDRLPLLNADSPDGVLANGRTDAPQVRIRVLAFDLVGTEVDILLAALAADGIALWRLLSGPLAFLGFRKPLIHVLMPPVHTRIDFRDWLQRSLLVVRGGQSFGRDIKVPLDHIREAEHLTPNAAWYAILAVFFGCTPLASLALILANHSEVVPGLSSDATTPLDGAAPRESQVVQMEAQQAILGVLAILIALLALLRALFGPEGLLWVGLLVHETTSVCARRTPSVRDRFESSVCGFRCRRTAWQSMFVYWPLFVLLWLIYAGVAASGQTDAAVEAQGEFPTVGVPVLVVGLFLLVVYGGFLGCCHNLPISSMPLARALGPGVAVGVAMPRRNELCQSCPCPLIEANARTLPGEGRLDPVFDVVGRVLGLMPRGATHFRLDPHPTQEGVVLIPGVAAAATLIRALEPADLLERLTTTQQKMLAGLGADEDTESDSEDDLVKRAHAAVGETVRQRTLMERMGEALTARLSSRPSARPNPPPPPPPSGRGPALSVETEAKTEAKPSPVGCFGGSVSRGAAVTPAPLTAAAKTEPTPAAGKTPGPVTPGDVSVVAPSPAPSHAASSHASSRPTSGGGVSSSSRGRGGAAALPTMPHAAAHTAFWTDDAPPSPAAGASGAAEPPPQPHEGRDSSNSVDEVTPRAPVRGRRRSLILASLIAAQAAPQQKGVQPDP